MEALIEDYDRKMTQILELLIKIDEKLSECGLKKKVKKNKKVEFDEEDLNTVVEEDSKKNDEKRNKRIEIFNQKKKTEEKYIYQLNSIGLKKNNGTNVYFFIKDNEILKDFSDINDAIKYKKDFEEKAFEQ